MKLFATPQRWSNHIIYSIRQSYYDVIKQDKEVTLFWVPAHVGIPGNESADQTAKSAATKEYKLSFKIPYEDLMAKATAQANEQSKEQMKLISASKDTLY